MMRDACSPMPIWFPPCRTSRVFAVVRSMQKEDAHCGDRKDHPLDTSQHQLSSAQKLFSPHTPEHIPGQQQSHTAPSHHAWGILQKEGCRGEMKEGVQSKLDLRGNAEDNPSAMLLLVRGLIGSEEHQQEEGNMRSSKEARGQRCKVFGRPGAESWHLFGGMNEKVGAW